jgi:hypothetical protein
MTTLCLKNSSITESEINKNLALCNLCLSQGACLINICQLIHNGKKESNDNLAQPKAFSLELRNNHLFHS